MGDPVLLFVALIRQGEHNGPQKEGKKMHGTWWGGPAIPRLVLPDYPETKGKLAKAYFKYFQFLQRQHSGPIGCVGSRRFVEPDRVVLHRADGSVSELSQKEIKAETTVDLKALRKKGQAEILQKMAEQAKEFASQKSKFFYESLHKQLTKAGRSVNLGGKPITPEVILDMYANVQISFDENGNPQIPTIVAGSQFLKAVEPALEEIATNPVYGQKFAEIIEKQKMDWREREANRKLVG